MRPLAYKGVEFVVPPRIFLFLGGLLRLILLRPQIFGKDQKTGKIAGFATKFPLTELPFLALTGQNPPYSENFAALPPKTLDSPSPLVYR